MNGTGKRVWAGAGVVLLAALYSIILFTLKREFNLSAWLLFSFTILAFLCLFLQVTLGTSVNSDAAYSAVTVMITLIYWIIQLVFGGIICMFFELEQSNVVLIAEVSLLVIYLVLLFAINNAHDQTQKQDISSRFLVQRKQIMEAEIRNLSDAQENPELKKQLDELADDIHYMDTLHPEESEEFDKIIAEEIGQMKYKQEENGDISDLIHEVKKTIRERNRRLSVVNK